MTLTNHGGNALDIMGTGKCCDFVTPKLGVFLHLPLKSGKCDTRHLPIIPCAFPATTGNRGRVMHSANNKRGNGEQILIGRRDLVRGSWKLEDGSVNTSRLSKER